LETDSDEAISFDSKSEFDEDTVAVGDNNNAKISRDEISPIGSGGGLQ
jgi:hypothetical protein